MAQGLARTPRRRLAALLFAPLAMAGALAAATPATAAPQAIALVASAEPIELRCHLGECGAEFTSFCLERNRRSPAIGTPYWLYDAASLKLEGRTRDGATVALDAGELQITSARGHTAVWMSLPASSLRERNLASVSVTVTAGATLLPEEEADDPKGHSAFEIERIAGPMRATGAKIVDQAGAPIAAAQQTARLINLLPRLGRTTSAERDSLWARASLAPDSAGYDTIKAGFDNCHEITQSGSMSLRQCLGSVHDAFVSRLNIRYWKATKTGS